MKPIIADVNLVAHCGLYCGACGAHLRGRCPGCHENHKATWCKVRSCCMENGYSSCADCRTISDPADCKKYNNLISKLFGLVFRSDRRACIVQIRQKGISAHAELMAAERKQSIKR
jgi:hypothetical protein